MESTSMWGLRVALILWLVAATLTIPPGNSSAKSVISADVAGDLILGGLFPVHSKAEGDSPCGKINRARGIQRLEAMLYTIDEINNDPRVLTNITLGARVFDTCSKDTYALEQSLEYVRASMNTLDSSDFFCNDGKQAVPKHAQSAVAGVIGGAFSSVSLQVANLLRLFKIPQVSYASTSAALSDKTRFDYFARTVPPDTLQAKAMVDILIAFNWTYVNTVASEGDYGESGIESFNNEARAHNICIAFTIKIGTKFTKKDFDEKIKDLMRKPHARVVILFTRIEDAKNILSAATRANITDHFVWVASDGWGTQKNPVRGNEVAASGAITLELQSEVVPGFTKYFESLDPRTNLRNPWFKEYWENKHDCQFPENWINMTKRECTGREKILDFVQETKIQFVYDAVYAMALALHNMHADLCRGKLKMCPDMVHIDGAKLYQDYILKLSFEDRCGSLVKFDKFGDGMGRYNILNYRRTKRPGPPHYEYARVGRWANQLRLDEKEKITWAGGLYETPTSFCSPPCKKGEIKHVQDGESCCWVCTVCQPWEYLKDEFTCESCGMGRWPFPDKRSCYQLTQQYMQWTSVYALVPIGLSCFGIMLTMLVILTFVRFNDTPVVKASGRELSFMLLCGCLICYLMSFVLLAKPTTVVCSIQRFGVGFGFSVMYSSLLTKTNRISRIFDSASKSARRPNFISPKSQVVICSILILIQVGCTCVWLVVEPPGTRQYYPNGRTKEVILKCKIKDVSFLISLTYNMLLIIICTVYAVKTRKIPENFNESKFIGFTMYTTCIIWLAFVPIYFGTLNSFEIQITTLCVSISLSASVTLLCLFAPKMYIIVFQPEKNVRRLTMNSAQYKKAATSSNSGCGGLATNHGSLTTAEHIKLHMQGSPYRGGAGGMTTETETDRDSMASL